jgi:hypothetical protein
MLEKVRAAAAANSEDLNIIGHPLSRAPQWGDIQFDDDGAERFPLFHLWL